MAPLKSTYLLILLIAFGPLAARAQDCDAKSLKELCQTADYLAPYVNDSSAPYRLTLKPADKKLIVSYRGKKIGSFDYVNGEPKINRAEGEWLELVFMGDKQKGRHSYFYIAGQEIRTLIPEISEDYFRVKAKKGKDSLLFEFDAGYAVYNLKTGKFCRPTGGT